ncbi:MAG: N-acetylmuramoyl-L-alanine amidase [Clostridia bacterium]
MILVIRRGILFLGIGLIILIIAMSFMHSDVPAMSFNHENYKCIIIDPGHGTPDGGAVSKSGTVESSLNLSISKKLEQELTERGYKVIMTREGEDGLDKKKKADMEKRLSIMKNTQADMFISIHINKFHQSKYRGAEVLYSDKFIQSTLLAQLIMDEMTSIDPQNQSRQIKKADNSLYLMKNSTIPAIIVECGFLSNAEEEKLLCDDIYQSRIASAICDGIVAYYKNIEDFEKIDSAKSEGQS